MKSDKLTDKMHLVPAWLRRYLSQEDYLAIQVSNYLKFKGLFFTHTPNEGKRSRTQSHKMNALGVKKGIPDLLIFEPRGGFHGLAVELKVVYESGAKNYASKEQKDCIAHFRARGWRAEIIYNFEAFEELLESYLEDTPIRSEKDKPLEASYLMSLHKTITRAQAEDLLRFCKAHTIKLRGCYGSGEIMLPKWREEQALKIAGEIVKDSKKNILQNK